MNLWSRLKQFSHFLHSLYRVNRGLLHGAWKLTKLPQPAITVFGGTKLQLDDPHSQKICAITKQLARKGFSIITGGGPGIMEAANLGAFEESKNDNHKKIKSVGIALEGLGTFNVNVQFKIVMPYFFSRKWLLVRYAVGFIVGPGGFGTLDELAEVLTLLQTHHMPQTPVVLIGTDYWKPLLSWVHDRALKHGLLSKEDSKLLYVTDDIDEAVHIISTKCATCPDGTIMDAEHRS